VSKDDQRMQILITALLCVTMIASFSVLLVAEPISVSVPDGIALSARFKPCPLTLIAV